MTHSSDCAGLQHAAHRAATVEETQFVIDQRQHACGVGLFHHPRGFAGIQRHRFLA